MNTNDMIRRLSAAYDWPTGETAVGVAWYLRQIGLQGTTHLDANTVARFERVFPLI